jgi:hypothetical protein
MQGNRSILPILSAVPPHAQTEPVGAMLRDRAPHIQNIFEIEDK